MQRLGLLTIIILNDFSDLQQEVLANITYHAFILSQFHQLAIPRALQPDCNVLHARLIQPCIIIIL